MHHGCYLTLGGWSLGALLSTGDAQDKAARETREKSADDWGKNRKQTSGPVSLDTCYQVAVWWWSCLQALFPVVQEMDPPPKKTKQECPMIPLLMLGECRYKAILFIQG